MIGEVTIRLKDGADGTFYPLDYLFRAAMYEPPSKGQESAFNEKRGFTAARVERLGGASLTLTLCGVIAEEIDFDTHKDNEK